MSHLLICKWQRGHASKAPGAPPGSRKPSTNRGALSPCSRAEVWEARLPSSLPGRLCRGHPPPTRGLPQARGQQDPHSESQPMGTFGVSDSSPARASFHLSMLSHSAGHCWKKAGHPSQPWSGCGASSSGGVSTRLNGRTPQLLSRAGEGGNTRKAGIILPANPWEGFVPPIRTRCFWIQMIPLISKLYTHR